MPARARTADDGHGGDEVTWVGTAPRDERYETALTMLAQVILDQDADVDSVLISPTTVLLAKGTTVVRFLLSAEARAAVARHVEGAGPFEPGAHVLEPPRGATAEAEEAMAAVLVRLDRAKQPPADNRDKGADRWGAPGRRARMAGRRARARGISWWSWGRKATDTATSRWEGQIHYYDYEPDTIARRSGMDAFTVAEAFIYNPDNTASLALVFVVSGPDLHVRGVTMERAVAEARRNLEQLTRPGPGTFVEDAKTLKQHKVLLFSWNGQPLGQGL